MPARGGVRRLLRPGHADLARLALADEARGALRRLVIDGDTGGPRRERPQGYRHYLDVVREPGRPPAARQAGHRRLGAPGARRPRPVPAAVRPAPRAVGRRGLNRRIAGWLHEAG
jgi:hypothetical protein